MLSGLKHVHSNKCVHHTTELAQKKKAFVRIVDSFAYLSVIVPLLTIPQFITIFVHHDASNLSLITWGTYLVSATYWTYYGWLHKAKPIWIPNTLMILVDIGVVAGILMYS